jgi:hypothetical protein
MRKSAVAALYVEMGSSDSLWVGGGLRYEFFTLRRVRHAHDSTHCSTQSQLGLYRKGEIMNLKLVEV